MKSEMLLVISNKDNNLLNTYHQMTLLDILQFISSPHSKSSSMYNSPYLINKEIRIQWIGLCWDYISASALFYKFKKFTRKEM